MGTADVEAQVSGVRCQAHLLEAVGKRQVGCSEEDLLSLRSRQAKGPHSSRLPATGDARLNFSSDYVIDNKCT
jgi:hypothetical protein